MKKILLISTGGTIASRQGGNGLEPQLKAGELLDIIGEISPDIVMEYEDILQLDSSNIQPEHWQIIAQRVYENLDKFDGIIITHGTDTMAYTAAAMSFMLQNIDICVVLTGSQLPIECPLSDARTNLHTAIAAVEGGIKGVTVAFNRKIIRGTRAVKLSTMDFDAFDSVNVDCVGQIFADGLRISQSYMANADTSKPAKLEKELCPDVFLLKLLPGTKPEFFDALVGLGYRGLIVEAFGVGGVHYINRDVLQRLQSLTSEGIAVVVCSQCLYERSDLSIYEVGQRMLANGVISGRDMTTEAAAVKLMWALGQTSSVDEITRIFHTNYVGEITI